MNALASKQIDREQQTDRDTNTPTAQLAVGFDARARLRGELDDMTVRQAVVGMTTGRDGHSDPTQRTETRVL